MVDEVGHVVGTWWWPVHGHNLGGPGVATPWTQTDDGASAGHELFDTGDTGTRQPDGRLGDATRREGSVDGGSFGPDVDTDRVRLVRLVGGAGTSGGPGVTLAGCRSFW